MFLLLGSFAPRRIRTSLPGFTPPAPYTIEDNPDTLLDRTDLVLIDPVGIGYSAAVATKVNRDLRGVDPDTESIVGFIKRHLSAYDRWNSPKFLFGESYGKARSCVVGWKLYEDGVDLNGIVLQSSILDYGQTGNPVGLLPTLAADAWCHGRAGAVRPARHHGRGADLGVRPLRCRAPRVPEARRGGARHARPRPRHRPQRAHPPPPPAGGGSTCRRATRSGSCS